MSIAFTIPSGETLQSLAFYNELQLAYSERIQALGGSAQTLFVEDAYWQKLSMYQTWQNWLEANCTSFIDHVNGPLNPAGTNFLYFTLATWRAAAGLNASGFSRYDKDGNFIAYGIAQDDDLICNKLFLELQSGFGMLKSTIRSGSIVALVSDSKTAIGTHPDDDTCVNVRNSQKANWGTGGTWGEAIYNIYGGLIEEGVSNWWCMGAHATGKSSISNISTCCPHSTELYLSSTGDGYVYEDMEGLFFGEGKYGVFETFSSATIDNHLSAMIGDYTLNPIELTTLIVCPNTYIIASCRVDRHSWLLTWNFTNA